MPKILVFGIQPAGTRTVQKALKPYTTHLTFNSPEFNATFLNDSHPLCQ